MKITYGKGQLELPEIKNLQAVITPNQCPAIPDFNAAIKDALRNPIGKAPLRELVTPKSKIAILISDKTRYFCQNDILHAIFNELHDIPPEQFTIVIGNAIHKCEDPALSGLDKEIISKYKISNHNCRSGLNKAVKKADFRILIGQIKPHLFAGFGGGAKALVPGTASILTIARNHLMMSHPTARLGNLDGNVVRNDIEKKVRKYEPLFILNVVLNADKEIVKVVAGDMVEAHREGVKTARQIGEVKAEKSDIVILSGSFPEAVNIYQTSKLLTPATQIVKENGIIICATPCPDGVGGFVPVNIFIYGLLLKNILPKNVTLLLVSDLPGKVVKKSYLTPASSIEEALQMAYKKIGPNATTTVIQNPGLIIPK